MPRSFIQPAYKFTQAEIDAGKAAGLSGARVIVVDTAGVATGVVYEGQSGPPTQVQTSSSGGAPLGSPAFTGTPTAPTATPGTNTTQIATTAFVMDSVAAGIAGLDFKGSARVATTANITLSGIQTIDGVALVAADRVLVKNQTTASQNGIYSVASGAWARSTDADANKEVSAGLAVYVEEGAVNGGALFVMVTAGAINVGATALIFARLNDPSASVVDAINDGVTATAPSQNAVFDALALKQVALVSATNIKTVNGSSLLGAGDLAIVPIVTNTAIPVLAASATRTASGALAAGVSEGFGGLPTDAIAVTLKPTGSLTVTSNGAQPTVSAWELPSSIGRLWLPSNLPVASRALDLDFTAMTVGAFPASMVNAGSIAATFSGSGSPTIAVDAIGKNALTLNGANQYLASAGAVDLGANYGMFVLFRPTVFAGALICAGFNGSNSVAYGMPYINMGVNGNGNFAATQTLFAAHYNGAWKSVGAASASVANTIDMGIGMYDGALMHARRFGVDNTAPNTSNPIFSSQPTYIGRRWDTAATPYFGGTIFRIVGKAGAAWTAAEMDQLEGWGAYLTGSVASLASAHTYKLAPPVTALATY